MHSAEKKTQPDLIDQAVIFYRKSGMDISENYDIVCGIFNEGMDL